MSNLSRLSSGPIRKEALARSITVAARVVAAGNIATLIGPIALAPLLGIRSALVVTVGKIGIDLTAFAVFWGECRVEWDQRLVLPLDRSIRIGVVIEVGDACDNDRALNAL